VDIEAATELVAIRSRAKVNWHIFHTECDSNRTVADHVVWTRRFSNTNDLLLEMADLSERKAWFRATNWQGLIRRILADTNRFSDTYCVRRERKKRPSEMKTVMELGSEDNDRN
jgi:hypothetical protein